MPQKKGRGRVGDEDEKHLNSFDIHKGCAGRAEAKAPFHCRFIMFSFGCWHCLSLKGKDQKYTRHEMSRYPLLDKL